MNSSDEDTGISEDGVLGYGGYGYCSHGYGYCGHGYGYGYGYGYGHN